MSALARLAGAALCLGATACQGTGVPASEIPDPPIAIVYRSPEEGRRRADALWEEQEKNEEVEAVEGVAPVDTVASYLSGLFGAGREAASDYPGRLALLEPRTRAVEVVTSALAGAIPLDWSADHRRLLFAQSVSGHLQLFELVPATGEVRGLTRVPMAHPRGCYGPGGRIVVMAVDPRVIPPRIGIRITGVREEEPAWLSTEPLAHSPACAPDGSAIAYVAVRERGAEHIVVRAPVFEGTPRAVAPGRDPTFSPDGQWIVFRAPVRAGWELWRVRTDGTARSPIGRGRLDELRPTVSPDGSLVAYVGEVGFRPQLYLRRIDGTGDRIFFSEGDADHPTW